MYILGFYGCHLKDAMYNNIHALVVDMTEHCTDFTHTSQIKWKRQLHSKAAEIDQFRVELDSILSVLQVLQDSMSL